MGRFSFTRAAFRRKFGNFKKRPMQPVISNDSTITEGKPQIQCHPQDTEWIRKQFEKRDFMDKLSDATIVAGTVDIFGKLYGVGKYFTEHGFKDTAKASLKQFEFRTNDSKKSEADASRVGEEGKTESQHSQPTGDASTKRNASYLVDELYAGTAPWIVALLKKLEVEVPASPPNPSSEAKDEGAPKEVHNEKENDRDDEDLGSGLDDFSD